MNRIEIITSMQNKYVSLARVLADRKAREKNELFRFDGVKLLCEALRCGVEIEFALVSESEYDSIFEKAKRIGGSGILDTNLRLFVVKDTLFERISEEKSPEGIICVAKYMKNMHIFAEQTDLTVAMNEKILLLESVRDPLNVGAIIRVAAAFGVDRIIMSKDCADLYSSKTVRSSMGMLFCVKICRVESVSEAALVLRNSGRRVFAAALGHEAVKLGRFDIIPGDCVMIGNEGHGLTEKAIDACTDCVYIPMSNGVESLNAATAAAVLLWEFFGNKS